MKNVSLNQDSVPNYFVHFAKTTSVGDPFTIKVKYRYTAYDDVKHNFTDQPSTIRQLNKETYKKLF